MTRKRHEDYSNMVQRLYAGDDISVNHALCRNITFQVTSGCNLRCSYCYEHHKGAEHMSIETGRKIVDYLLELYEQGDSDFINRNTRAVVLDFIGGEPLLEASLIVRICAKAQMLIHSAVPPLPHKIIFDAFPGTPLCEIAVLQTAR